MKNNLALWMVLSAVIGTFWGFIYGTHGEYIQALLYVDLIMVFGIIVHNYLNQNGGNK